MTALLRLIFSHFRGRKDMDFLDMDVATRRITKMGAAYNGHTQVWLRLPICITSSPSVTLYPSELYSGSGLSSKNALSSVFWYYIPIHVKHLLLNPILPVFILPFRLKDALVHELFEVVTGF